MQNLRFVLFVSTLCLTALQVQAQTSDGTTKRGRAAMEAVKEMSIKRTATYVQKFVRLDVDQSRAFVTETKLGQVLDRTFPGMYLSDEDCPMLVPLEPGEVSYISGTRVKRDWLQDPPKEVVAFDALQCRICKLQKAGLIDEQTRDDWIIKALEEMVPIVVEADKRGRALGSCLPAVGKVKRRGRTCCRNAVAGKTASATVIDMKVTLVLVGLLLVGGVISPCAVAQISSSNSRIRFPTPSSPSESRADAIGELSRLDSAQLGAFLTETKLGQTLWEISKGGDPLRDQNCPKLLPLEPGVVSYVSGTKFQRKWLQEPPANVVAFDELQCRVCQLEKAGKIDVQTRDEWILKSMEEMLPLVTEADKQSSQLGVSP